MTISSLATKSLPYLCLGSLLLSAQQAHADVYRTSTGQCVLTSNTFIEGGYQNPNNGQYWKYVPCDDATTKEKPQQKDNSGGRGKPITRLKGSFRNLVSSIRNKLETCLPFSAGSCSRAPDTIPVEWLALGEAAGGLAWRVTHEGDPGKMQLNPSTPKSFPGMVKTNRNGGSYVEFEKMAKVCQAFQNDARYVTTKGELSRTPARNSILNNYQAYSQLSLICHELIHMGECASCLSPIGSEKEAYEFELKAAQSAARLAPKETKALFTAYARDRAAFVHYMSCRETSDNVTCINACMQAGYSAERCQKAGDFYGNMGSHTIGHKHEDDKTIVLGILTVHDLFTPAGTGDTSESTTHNNGSSPSSSSGNNSEPTGDVTKFSLTDGTVFTCAAGNVAFKVRGSDNIERGYCCPAGSTTINVGANLDGQCV